MFCHKCGTQIADGVDFCHKCGTKLITDSSAQPPAFNSVEPAQSESKTPAAVPKKKKPKKSWIVLGIVFALIVILIAANADSLAQRGEQALKDEEYIESQQQSSEVSTNAGHADDKLLYHDIPIDTIMEMSAEDVIAAFGEPDVYEPDDFNDGDKIEYQSDQLYFNISTANNVVIVDAPAEKVTLGGKPLNQNLDSLISLMGDNYQALGADGYRWDKDGLSYTFYIPSDDDIADIIEVSKMDAIDTDEPIDNDAYLKEDTPGDSNSALPKLPDGFEWVEEPTGKTDEMLTKITGIIRNTSDKTYSYVSIRFNLYDSSGNQIGTAVAAMNDLKAGGTWKFSAIGTGNAPRFGFSSFDGF